MRVGAPCDNYFQLHRQLSAGLELAGARNGTSIVADDSYDPEFIGEIVCDVRNHQLTDQQRWAVRHLCEHIEADLEFSNYRSPKNPAEPIRVEPILG